MKKLFLFFILNVLIIFILGFVSAETISLKGLVINHLGNQVEGTKISYQMDGKESTPIYTNSNGAYTIDVPLSLNPLYLEFSKEGYRTEALVIYQKEGIIIVKDQSFDRCFPKDNSGKSLPGAKPNQWEFQTKEEAIQTELNTFLYPFSDVYIYWDVPVTAFINYNFKTCPTPPSGPGNSNLKTEHVLGMTLPLSYDATLILTTEGNKKENIPITNSEFGKNIKVYKKNGEIITEICKGESCNPPKESFFVKYLYYIIGIVLLILIIFILFFILRKKSNSNLIQ